jgi:DNA repair photolyase
VSRLKREASKLKGELVSVSNSSDPYPRLDREAGLTRQCLEILVDSNCRVQIVTKSDLVTRDIDILQRMTCVVSVTVLTLDDSLSRKLEPGAPASSRRLEAIAKLVKAGIPTTVRVDPVIPFVNDDVAELVDTVAGLGAVHVTSSTYKVKPDNWKRFTTAFPEVSEKLKPLYFGEGERIGGSTYLPKEMRFMLMKNVKDITEKQGMKFGCCREGFSINSGVCDGSGAIDSKQ